MAFATPPSKVPHNMSPFQAWSHAAPPFPTTVQLVDVTPPTAEQLKPTEVLIEVVAASLNPVDVQLANASVFRLSALAKPTAIGADFSGRILAKGSAVTEFATGDEVLGMSFTALGRPIQGALSQVVHVDLASVPLLKKPPSLSFAEAASLPLVFMTAMTTLSEPNTILPSPSAELEKPTIVVLGGSSGVGIYAVQYAARRLNAKVIATCSGAKADFVRSLGAETIIDYTTESIPERLQALRPSEGYLAIIDTVGGTELLPVLDQLVIPRSKPFPSGGAYISIVGDKTDRSQMGGSIIYYWTPRMIWRHLLGWAGWGPRYATVDLVPEKSKLEVAVKLTEEGMKVVIDSEFAFEDVLKAYERLNSGKAKGKVVVKVRKE
ncbi:hypothetical protein BCR35DRAFT_307148 [Leucosporidium creatinivorum]|uniref:Enoyl reductase (ER) domain-containing protein n=1 Tax=Leucosporidium creatinivorum TaxID=106004 RepID=A0A1Y2EPH7_9BASI|nr:hypothetical protein BCR35DRAFT_307148 [Leucosporidium creatinivorum]